MKIYRLSQLSLSSYRQLLSRPKSTTLFANKSAETICLDVKSCGDVAVKKYNSEFDGSSRENFKISPEERFEAFGQVSSAFREALLAASNNIRRFHTAQTESDGKIETMPGVVCWRERRPIERVGLYIPSGSAPLPSTVLMLGIPAIVAGCSRIVVCSPGRNNGAVDPLILAAAQIIGLREIYGVGGAQAIAAMAYGTESVPKVDKIFGPGNYFVAAAKQFVSSDPDGVAVDMFAGPSELFIIADETADPETVAIDLLSQAEHDPHSQVVLATTSVSLGKRVQQLLPHLMEDLPRKAILETSLAESFVIISDSVEGCLEFANDYAPEHLLLNLENPQKLLARIRNAGSVFLGSYAPVTAGDYASGTNHTLPTGGSARWSSGISVQSFQKSISFQTITEEGLQKLAPILTAMAAGEGLEAHKRAVECRMKKLKSTATVKTEAAKEV